MGDVIVRDVWCHTITFCPVSIESGADGVRREIISHPGIFLQWVSWVLDGTFSSRLVAGSPCSR